MGWHLWPESAQQEGLEGRTAKPCDHAKALSSRTSDSIETLLRKSRSVARVRKASFETAAEVSASVQRVLNLAFSSSITFVVYSALAPGNERQIPGS